MTDLDIQLATARAQVATLEREIAQGERSKLEAEHRELVMQCRTAKEEVSRLREETNELRNKSIHLNGEVENARRHVGDCIEPSPYTYPSAEEMEAWRSKLGQRQQALNAAQEDCWAAWGAYEKARGSWLLAKGAFEKLADRESMLRAQLQPQRSGITVTVYDAGESVRIYRT